jgi:hypothetical protein
MKTFSRCIALAAWAALWLDASMVAAETRWLPPATPPLELRGLPWFRENAPELWRLPRSAQGGIPAAVWRRAVAPDGARIRFSSTTTRLSLRAHTRVAPTRPCFVDVYADDVLVGSARVPGGPSAEIVLFTGRPQVARQLTVYLPHNHEVSVDAVGVDADAEVTAPAAFALSRPLVCYGSSVLQGTGAAHPAKTYPAALARPLNLDFVNLGFGGAGKAEPVVVDLVNQLDAASYLLDLGKSYGDQGPAAFRRMLATLRASHPTTPIICVTPIYSTKEPDEPAYREKSVRLRQEMRAAALERQAAGDKLTLVVEGLELFGEPDKKLFHDPQHPNDEGNELIAQRLLATVRTALSSAR